MSPVPQGGRCRSYAESDGDCHQGSDARGDGGHEPDRGAGFADTGGYRGSAAYAYFTAGAYRHQGSRAYSDEGATYADEGSAAAHRCASTAGWATIDSTYFGWPVRLFDVS